MAVDFLLIAFALVFPGAAAIKVWDFVGRIEGRSKISLLGFGAFISLVLYASLQRAGILDLTKLFTDDGKPKLSVVFATGNMCLFAGACTILVLLTWILSKVAHAEFGQKLACRVWGRTLGGSNWMEATGDSLGRWVDLRTSDGREWMGVVDLLPDKESGHIRLRWPEYHDPAEDKWLGGNESVVVPAQNIQYLLVLAEEAKPNDHGKEGKLEGKQDRGGGQPEGKAVDHAAISTPKSDQSDIPARTVGNSDESGKPNGRVQVTD